MWFFAGISKLILYATPLFLISEALNTVIGLLLITITQNNYKEREGIVNLFPILIKQFGAIFIVMPVFILASIFRLPWDLVLTTLLIPLAILLVYAIKYQNLTRTLKFFFEKHWKKWAVFYATYLILVLLRLNFPYFNVTERPMDSLFIHSFIKQKFIPFENPWLSGVVLNYYYLGHFYLSILLKLSGTNPTYGYNMLIGLVAVWILQALWQAFYVFAQQLHLKKAHLLIWLLSFTLTFGGNFYILFKEYIPKLIRLLTKSPTTPVDSIFYPAASRVIPNTINEFPSYSIVVGDLHGHYIGLANFILMTVLLYLIISRHYKKLWDTPLLPVATGLGIAFSFTTNSWEVISLLIWSIVVFVSFTVPQLVSWFKTKNWEQISQTFTDYMLLGISAAIPILIYKTWFLPPIEGIGFKIHHDYKWAHLLWGQFGIILIFLILVSTVHTGYLLLRKRAKFNLSKFFNIYTALIITGVILITLVNFFFVKSIFYILKTPHYRANTVFKIYYTAWPLLGIGTFLAILKFLENQGPKLRLPGAVILLTTISIMWVYPGLWLKQAFNIHTLYDLKTLIIKARNIPNSLDGTKYIQEQISVSDYNITRWIREKYPNTPLTIMELTDWSSYNNKIARVCTATGNTCVLGWPLHNYQWYKSLDPEVVLYPSLHKARVSISKRLTDIQEFYVTPSLQVLQTYTPDIVILGTIEKNFISQKGGDAIKTILWLNEYCQSWMFNNNDPAYPLPKDKYKAQSIVNKEASYIFVCH